MLIAPPSPNPERDPNLNETLYSCWSTMLLNCIRGKLQTMDAPCPPSSSISWTAGILPKKAWSTLINLFSEIIRLAGCNGELRCNGFSAMIYQPQASLTSFESRKEVEILVNFFNH